MFRLFLTLAICFSVHAAEAQQSIYDRMVGEWRDMLSATTIIIREDGTVFAAGSPIYGAVERSIQGGGNFAFENEKARCAYDVVLVQNDTTASWRMTSETLKAGTPANFCPRIGNLIRIETPEQTAARNQRAAERERAREAQRQAELLAARRAEEQRSAELARLQEQQRLAAANEKARLEQEIKAKVEAEMRAKLATEEAQRRQAAAAEAATKAREETLYGPEELRNVDVLYWDRSVDQGRVTTALNTSKIRFRTRPSVSSMPVNTLTCTTDVDLKAVKRLATILINAGVPIRMIVPSRYTIDQRPQYLSIEASDNAMNHPLLTLAQVQQMTTCDTVTEFNTTGGGGGGFLFNPPASAGSANRRGWPIEILNACSGHTLHISIRYYNATSKEWETSNEYYINPNEKREMTDSAGGEVRTTNEQLYFFAQATANSGSGTKIWQASETTWRFKTRIVDDTEQFRNFREQKSTSVLRLTCN